MNSDEVSNSAVETWTVLGSSLSPSLPRANFLLPRILSKIHNYRQGVASKSHRGGLPLLICRKHHRVVETFRVCIGVGGAGILSPKISEWTISLATAGKERQEKLRGFRQWRKVVRCGKGGAGSPCEREERLSVCLCHHRVAGSPGRIGRSSLVQRAPGTSEPSHWAGDGPRRWPLRGHAPIQLP